MTVHHLMLFLHLFAVTVWVGGMALVVLCLSPAMKSFSSSQKMTLWVMVWKRFFPFAWGAVVILLVSGGWMLMEVGFSKAPRAWHAMTLTGSVMIVVFLSVWLGPWRHMVQAVWQRDWAHGEEAMKLFEQRIRFVLALSVVTIAVATLGLGVRG